VRVSRYVILGFGIFMGFLSLILNALELSLGWVYLMMGIFIGSAVFPVALVLTWSKANAEGAIAGAVGGLLAGIISWIVACNINHGEINVDNLGTNYPMLTGNLFAILTSGVIHIAYSFVAPQNFDFSLINERISLIDDALPNLDDEETNPEMQLEARKWIMKWGLGFTIIMVIIWPVLSVPAGVFSKEYFGMWVAISIIWGFVATVVIVVLPVYESRAGIYMVISGLFFNDDLHIHMDDIDHKLDSIIKHLNVDYKPLALGEGTSMEPAYRAKTLARASSSQQMISKETASA